MRLSLDHVKYRLSLRNTRTHTDMMQLVSLLSVVSVAAAMPSVPKNGTATGALPPFLSVSPRHQNFSRRRPLLLLHAAELS